MMITFLLDVEEAIINALREAFPTVPFSTREPAKRPSPWVRVLVGGSDENTVPIHERITFSIECWHESSEVEANKLAQEIRREIQRWGWERGFELSDSEGSALVVATSAPRPYSYPPGDRWVRYSGTYQITLRRLSL